MPTVVTNSDVDQLINKSIVTEFAKERIIEATNEGKRVADTLREEFEDKSES